MVGYYVLGPVLADGSVLESARVSQATGEWLVNPVLRPGEDGIDRFNQAVAPCYHRTAECPTGQLAIVVDGIVISAPGIQQPTYERDQIQISGGFDEAAAAALAARLDAVGAANR